MKKLSDTLGLLNRIFGFFEFLSETKESERLINILNKRKYRIWRVRKHDSGGLTFRCSLFAAYSIIHSAKDSGFPLKIQKSVGLPFVIGKYRERTGLAIGTFLTALILIISSFFIWDIRVVDHELTPELYNALKAVGCHSGQYILGYDVSRAKHQFLLDNSEYSFFAINIRGTIAFVELKKRVQLEPNEKDSYFCHIIASEDAQIVDVIALKGRPVIWPGETVEKGQLLVTGEVEDKFGVIHPVHSVATINAILKKQIEVKIPIKQTKKQYTGKSQTKTTISAFGMDVNLYLDDIPAYEFSDVSFNFNRLSLFNYIRLPIDAFIYRYDEFLIQEVKISDEDAAQIAEIAFMNEAKRHIDGGLLLTTEKKRKKDTAEEYYILSGEITFIKDIAVKEPFEFVPIPKESP